MSNENESRIIKSPLCEKMTVDGRAVEIEIYGMGQHDWILEVVDEEGNSVDWDGTFKTDALAYNTFDEQLYMIITELEDETIPFEKKIAR